MAWVMAGLQLVGGAYTAMSQVNEGLETRTESRVQAAQLDRNAQQTQAYSTRAANEERRRSRLLQSTLIARAAASGGGTDGTVDKLFADIGDEGEYRAALRVYEGGEEAAGMRGQADALRRGGDISAKAGKRRATATLFNTASDIYGKYG